MRWRRTGSGAGLFRWRTHADEGGERSRADETGPGRGCATALSSAPGARRYPQSSSSISLVSLLVVVLKTVTVLRHFQKKVKNLQMEADRLELIARHKFAPSNRPRLFARPMRVQIVLGARLYPAWFTHGRWPVPFRAAGLRGRWNRR
jgi:hypothetical protein